jgi:signal transduction histidine kinase
MRLTTTDDDSSGELDPAMGPLPFMPSRREMALIVAFWAAYAVLTMANRIFDPGGGGGPPGFNSARAIIAAAESLCWALLTPPLFWLAGRLELEATVMTSPRVRRIVLLALVGFATAALVGWIGTELRTALISRPTLPSDPGALTARSRTLDGPRFWFGFLNGMIIAFGVIASGIARAYSLRYRARREQTARLGAQLAEARLDALRRQLDPHFLFNTLNAVSSLVERDPPGVRRMIARLGDLLRYSFEGGSEPEVPLRQELSLLGRYVDIMQVRFQGRLSVTMQMDDGVLDALVPGLILQPLVENAIKYGVENRTDGGRITVSGAREGDMLVLRVQDEGARAGTSGSPREVAPRGAGLGLRNTRERLAQLYGPAQGFALTQAIGGGATAEVRLPFHTNGGRSVEARPRHASSAAPPVEATDRAG